MILTSDHGRKFYIVTEREAYIFFKSHRPYETCSFFLNECSSEHMCKRPWRSQI